MKFDIQSLEKSALELISRLAPDFVGLSAENLDQVRDSQLPGKIQQLNSLVASVKGRSILLDIDDKRGAALARQSGFGLVQGRYFELPVTSANKPDADNKVSKPESYQSRRAV